MLQPNNFQLNSFRLDAPSLFGPTGVQMVDLLQRFSVGFAVEYSS